ncbi:unnamed protein product, partial [marine sediment metagenome]
WPNVGIYEIELYVDMLLNKEKYGTIYDTNTEQKLNQLLQVQ